MRVTVEIPDAVAIHLNLTIRNAPRELLEAFAVEEYRMERLSRGQVSELLGLNFWETEELLRKRGASLHYNTSDLEQDRDALKLALAK